MRLLRLSPSIVAIFSWAFLCVAANNPNKACGDAFTDRLIQKMQQRKVSEAPAVGPSEVDLFRVYVQELAKQRYGEFRPGSNIVQFFLWVAPQYIEVFLSKIVYKQTRQGMSLMEAVLRDFQLKKKQKANAEKDPHRHVADELVDQYKDNADFRFLFLVRGIRDAKVNGDPSAFVPSIDRIFDMLEEDLYRYHNSKVIVELALLLARGELQDSRNVRIHTKERFKEWLTSDWLFQHITTSNLKMEWWAKSRDPNLVRHSVENLLIRIAADKSKFDAVRNLVFSEEFSSHAAAPMLRWFFGVVAQPNPNIDHLVNILASYDQSSHVYAAIIHFFYENPLPKSLVHQTRKQCLQKSSEDASNASRWLVTVQCGDVNDRTYSVAALSHADQRIRSLAAANILFSIRTSGESLKPSVAVRVAKAHDFTNYPPKLAEIIFEYIDLVNIPTVLSSNPTLTRERRKHLSTLAWNRFSANSEEAFRSLEPIRWTKSARMVIEELGRSEVTEERMLAVVYSLIDADFAPSSISPKDLRGLSATIAHDFYRTAIRIRGVDYLWSLMQFGRDYSGHAADLLKDFSKLLISMGLESIGDIERQSLVAILRELMITTPYDEALFRTMVKATGDLGLWRFLAASLNATDPKLEDYTSVAMIHSTTDTVNLGVRSSLTKALLQRGCSESHLFCNLVSTNKAKDSKRVSSDKKALTANEAISPSTDRAKVTQSYAETLLMRELSLDHLEGAIDVVEDHPLLIQELNLTQFRSLLHYVLVQVQDGSERSDRERNFADMVASSFDFERVRQIVLDKKTNVVEAALRWLGEQLRLSDRYSAEGRRRVESVIAVLSQRLDFSGEQRFGIRQKIAAILRDFVVANSFRVDDELVHVFASPLIAQSVSFGGDAESVLFLVKWINAAESSQAELLENEVVRQLQPSIESIHDGSTAASWRVWKKVAKHADGAERARIDSVLNRAVEWQSNLKFGKSRYSLQQLSSLLALEQRVEVLRDQTLMLRDSVDRHSEEGVALVNSMEEASIAAAMLYELHQGRIPVLVDDQHHLGYDILSFDPRSDEVLAIEVKGKFSDGKFLIMSVHELNTIETIANDGLMVHRIYAVNIDAIRTTSLHHAINQYADIDAHSLRKQCTERTDRSYSIPRSAFEPYRF